MSKLGNIKLDPDKLRAARGERTLSEVAEIIGTSKQNLSNYENGHNQPSAIVLVKLCVLYRTPIESLITGAELFLKKEYSRA